MTLSPEQKQLVAAWVADGDNLAAIQKKLSEQLKVSLTYMDVRFLVDDLGLELRDATRAKADPKADLAKTAPETAGRKGGLLDRLKQAVGASGEQESGEPAATDDELDLEEEPPSAGGGAVKVDVDRVVRPGAAVSGSVTFSDGVSGKWAMDQYGRLMLETGRKGYQPPATDVESFQRELSRQLQRHGF